MFYSTEILNIKSDSNLGLVWLAATLGPKSNARKLARKDLSSISIPTTCSFLTTPPEPLSLRLSANLMVGVTRVYGQQCLFHWNDVQGLCTRINHVHKPANPDDINLSNNEKKGTNITMKKIDCISAVNILPGDTLNFPDLDISNLLSMKSSSERVSNISITGSMNIETGRRSITSSSLGTPFSSTNSLNTLQGSDFATAFSDNDGFDYSLNSNEYQIFPFKPKSLHKSDSKDNLEFQLPHQVEIRKASRMKRLKNSLMDMEITLGKNDLFLLETEKVHVKIKGPEINPIDEALRLLNNPDELFISETFANILPKHNLNFSYNSSRPNESSEQYYDNDDNLNDIEQYRMGPNSTPSSNSLPPWSVSGSGNDSIKGLSSIGFNTPIRKGNSRSDHSSPHSLSDSNDFHFPPFLSESSNNMNLSEETLNFFYFLHDFMRSEFGTTTFGNVLKRKETSRPIAARAFHHLLELKSSSLIEVEQSIPFSDIYIKIK